MISVNIRNLLLQPWAQKTRWDRDALDSRIEVFAALGLQAADLPDPSIPWTGLSPLAVESLSHIDLGVLQNRKVLSPIDLLRATIATGRTTLSILRELQPLVALGIVLPEAAALPKILPCLDGRLTIDLLSRDLDGERPWISEITAANRLRFILKYDFPVAETDAGLADLRAWGIKIPDLISLELARYREPRLLWLLTRNLEGRRPFIGRLTAVHLLAAACQWKETPAAIAAMARVLAEAGVPTPDSKVLDRWTSEPLPTTMAIVLYFLNSNDIDDRMLDSTRLALAARAVRSNLSDVRVFAERFVALGVGSIDTAETADLFERLFAGTSRSENPAQFGSFFSLEYGFYSRYTLHNLEMTKKTLILLIGRLRKMGLDEARALEGIVRFPIDLASVSELWDAAKVDDVFLSKLLSLVRIPKRGDDAPKFGALELVVGVDTSGVALSAIEPYLHVLEKLGIDVSEARNFARVTATQLD